MDKIAEELGGINKTLEKQNEITQGILDVMRKPQHPFLKMLTVAGIGVSVLGIIHIIDTVITWIGG